VAKLKASREKEEIAKARTEWMDGDVESMLIILCKKRSSVPWLQQNYPSGHKRRGKMQTLCNFAALYHIE
jgi:hypothetical protein